MTEFSFVPVDKDVVAKEIMNLDTNTILYHKMIQNIKA